MDVHHTFLSVFLAVRRKLPPDVEARLLGARVMRAPSANDAYHAFHSMPLAVHRRLAALEIVARHRRAGVV